MTEERLELNTVLVGACPVEIEGTLDGMETYPAVGNPRRTLASLESLYELGPA